MDMDTLGYFIYMNEMEQAQKEKEEDFFEDDDSNDEDE